MTNYLADDFELEAQKESVDVSTMQRNYSVGFLQNNLLRKNSMVITPSVVQKLVDNHVPVWVQRGLGKDNYIDLDYADVGAFLEDEASEVISRADIIVQLAPLTVEELSQLKDNQIVISYTDLEMVSKEDLSVLQQKKITALSLDDALDANGNRLVSTILGWNVDISVKCVALEDFLLAVFFALIFTGNIRHAVQRNPALLQIIYCYKGIITHKKLSDKYSLLWKDLLLLCWDWN